MLVLKNTTELVRLVTDAAVTVDVHASWADRTASADTPGSTNTAISTATTTTVVAAPAASTYRNVRRLMVRNRHASTSVTVTTEIYDGTTAFQIDKRVLAAGQSFYIDDIVGISPTLTAQGNAGEIQTNVGGLLTGALRVVAGTDYIAKGASPASVGYDRYPSAVSQLLVAGTKTLIGTDANDVFIGSDASGTNQATNTHVRGSTAVKLGVGAVSAVDVTATSVAYQLATQIQANAQTRLKLASDTWTATTSSNTQTTSFSWTIVDAATTSVTAETIAEYVDGTAGATWVRSARIRRNSGTVTITTADNDTKKSEMTAADCLIDNSTTTGRVRITGITSVNVQWGGIVNRAELTHA